MTFSSGPFGASFRQVSCPPSTLTNEHSSPSGCCQQASHPFRMLKRRENLNTADHRLGVPHSNRQQEASGIRDMRWQERQKGRSPPLKTAPSPSSTAPCCHRSERWKVQTLGGQPTPGRSSDNGTGIFQNSGSGFPLMGMKPERPLPKIDKPVRFPLGVDMKTSLSLPKKESHHPACQPCFFGCEPETFHI